MMASAGALARLAALLLGSRWLPGCRAIRSTVASAPVAVDFTVFLGSDAGSQAVAPRASMNIAGSDNTSGFYRTCGKSCPTFETSGPGWTAPQMRLCRCVAQRLVDDLNADFGELLSAGQPAGPLFELGHYAEVDAGQHFFNVENGHRLLLGLMEVPADSPYGRRPERLTVWIANNILTGGDMAFELAGTTLLDQPLYAERPGAGVLLSSQVPRNGRRLSHEVGHVVGFHHVAGPEVFYRYFHPQCAPRLEPIRWEMASAPSCEANIMGSWYDGPYCCPGSSLLQEIGGDAECLPNHGTRLREPYCCGQACRHRCPARLPPMTFATSEHRTVLADVLRCWLSLRGKPPPAQGALLAHTNSTGLAAGVQVGTRVVCIDALDRLGSCDSACPSASTSPICRQTV
mmetsp:Transcript_100639/g.313730  ORF Transcript_100639/g.313730 Transcript_100639/m.313730 type:complete len:402 (+) Transcript_100639:37-1242(+)